ncbi:MAG: hypothetical protein VW270_09605 [Candidatus Poseidoniales archaeon]
MASLFDDILVQGVRSGQIPARTQQARDWFREKARTQRSARAYPANLMKETGDKVDSPRIGFMYHFYYDPKGKGTLPYYDRFPLIFMVGPAPKGFYGINLHYLPPKLRATLMDNLYSVTSNQRYDEGTKLRISYSILKGASKYRFFKPTFKHYLTANVNSQFLKIDSAEWDIALFLPTERFEKAGKSRVFADSRKAV